MFKIGDFSRLAQVSVRMLRHYDKLGLLEPSYTDRFTGYRYYTIDQLPRLNRIVALNDLGFVIVPADKFTGDRLKHVHRRHHALKMAIFVIDQQHLPR